MVLSTYAKLYAKAWTTSGQGEGVKVGGGCKGGTKHPPIDKNFVMLLYILYEVQAVKK